MADDDKDKKGEGGPIQVALGLIAFLVVIGIGWFMYGGPSRADLNRLFLSPPPAPQINIPTGGGSGVLSQPTTTPQQ